METKHMDRPFLVGETVYLRPLDLNDVNEEYLNWINDGQVLDQLATVFPSPMYKLENFVKSVLDSPNYVFFAVIEKDTNKHIGNVKLGPIDWINRTSNLGLMLGDKDSWGKGYATETFLLIFKYAFDKLNIHKIWDLALASHKASLRACHKAGWNPEAELKEHAFRNGQYENAVVLSIFAEDFRRNQLR